MARVCWCTVSSYPRRSHWIHFALLAAPTRSLTWIIRTRSFTYSPFSFFPSYVSLAHTHFHVYHVLTNIHSRLWSRVMRSAFPATTRVYSSAPEYLLICVGFYWDWPSTESQIGATIFETVIFGFFLLLDTRAIFSFYFLFSFDRCLWLISRFSRLPMIFNWNKWRSMSCRKKYVVWQLKREFIEKISHASSLISLIESPFFQKFHFANTIANSFEYTQINEYLFIY